MSGLVCGFRHRGKPCQWRGAGRLPGIDGTDPVGIVAQADAARSMSDPQVGVLVDALSVDS
jgi:hypothetical protein